VDELTGTPAWVLHRMVTAFDTGDIDDVREYVDPEYLDHQGLDGERPIRGDDGFARVVAVARAAYEALDVTVLDVIGGNDRAAARVEWVGRRADRPTARRETIDIVRVERGRAVEHWGARAE
jgi:predicted SnoaL-like aldol condensation-catalyzing enzyme